MLPGIPQSQKLWDFLYQGKMVSPSPSLRIHEKTPLHVELVPEALGTLGEAAPC